MGAQVTKIDTSPAAYNKIAAEMDTYDGMIKIFKIIYTRFSSKCIHNDYILKTSYCSSCRRIFECDYVCEIDRVYTLLSPRLYKPHVGNHVFLIRPLPTREISTDDMSHIMNQEKIVDKIAQYINEYNENKLKIPFIEECMSSIIYYIKEYEKSFTNVKNIQKLKTIVNKTKKDNTTDDEKETYSTGIEGAPDAN